MTDDMTLSIVVPIFNERQSIPILYGEIKKTVEALNIDSEIIFIDDGSSDGSDTILLDLADQDKGLKVFSFKTNLGQHKAIEEGISRACGNVIVTMDGDLQNDPSDIPLLFEKICEGFDIVCGWRWLRHDPWHKKLKSRMGNWLQRRITGLGLHDISCTLRAYRADAIKGITLNNRYDISLIPLLVSDRAPRLGEVKIAHRERIFGKSKYSFFKTSAGTVAGYLRALRGSYE